jgi:hypothetical protein
MQTSHCCWLYLGIGLDDTELTQLPLLYNRSWATSMLTSMTLIWSSLSCLYHIRVFPYYSRYWDPVQFEIVQLIQTILSFSSKKIPLLTKWVLAFCDSSLRKDHNNLSMISLGEISKLNMKINGQRSRGWPQGHPHEVINEIQQASPFC